MAIRTLHYSRRTERAYAYWIRRFVTRHEPRDPALMGADEIRGFLSYLAVSEGVSASTQNQALCALVFLYSRVLGVKLEPMGEIERAKAPRRLPVVLSRGEVRAILDRIKGVPGLVCWLLYGAGLRLVECLSLRVKDIDFDRNELTVRTGESCNHTWTAFTSSTPRTSSAGWAALPCPSRSPRNTPGPTASGRGSTSSPRRPSTPTGTRASGTGIIFTRR